MSFSTVTSLMFSFGSIRSTLNTCVFVYLHSQVNDCTQCASKLLMNRRIQREIGKEVVYIIALTKIKSSALLER